MFRQYNSLNYRKRYKCPECKDYALYLIHDKACECKNDCNTDAFNINQIMNNNDFCGYFTSQELKETFYINDEECNNLFKKITTNNTLQLLSDSENKIIELFFQKTGEFDDRLDDIMVDYLNYNNLKYPQDLTPFGYIINLAEDIHFFINLCCKDVVLFNYGVEFASKHFYSGRFFYNNAVEHLFLSDERIYVILGILYGFSFEEELSRNKTFKIEEFLKKDSNYKSSPFKDIFKKLKGNNFYRELKEIRNSNAHDLSYLSKVIDKDIKTNSTKNYLFWSRDGDKIDKDFYLPKIKSIIFCLNEFYNLLDQILLFINNDKSVYQLETFPMFEKFMRLNISFTFNKYGSEDFERIEKRKEELFDKLPHYRNQLINDVFFRMDEVVHCISDIYNISVNQFYNLWRTKGVELVGLIDEQYLLYSALFRLYSCYDKLSRYIAQINAKYSNIRYFEEFENISDSDRIINKIRSILNNDNYKLLFQLRNDIYHNLRIGCLYGEQGLNYYNMVLFQTILENTIIIYEFIVFLDTNNKVKVGRNDPCTCGSGKKYKKCCGA